MNELSKKIKRGIVFIGMSGSGKTTIGKILAPLIGYRFIDSDRLIEMRFGKPLQDIVDSYEDKRKFLKMEGELIKSLILQKDILATGGSTCYSAEALQELGGGIVFLEISWEEIFSRLGSFAGRGVIVLHKDVREEYLVRQEMYRNLADVVIDCNQKSKDMIVSEVREKLEFQ